MADGARFTFKGKGEAGDNADNRQTFNPHISAQREHEDGRPADQEGKANYGWKNAVAAANRKVQEDEANGAAEAQQLQDGGVSPKEGKSEQSAQRFKGISNTNTKKQQQQPESQKDQSPSGSKSPSATKKEATEGQEAKNGGSPRRNLTTQGAVQQKQSPDTIEKMNNNEAPEDSQEISIVASFPNEVS